MQSPGRCCTHSLRPLHIVCNAALCRAVLRREALTCSLLGLWVPGTSLPRFCCLSFSIKNRLFDAFPLPAPSAWVRLEVRSEWDLSESSPFFFSSAPVAVNERTWEQRRGRRKLFSFPPVSRLEARCGPGLASWGSVGFSDVDDAIPPGPGTL